MWDLWAWNEEGMVQSHDCSEYLLTNYCNSKPVLKTLNMRVLSAQTWLFRAFRTHSLVNLHSSVKRTQYGNSGTLMQRCRKHVQKATHCGKSTGSIACTLCKWYGCNYCSCRSSKTVLWLTDTACTIVWELVDGLSSMWCSTPPSNSGVQHCCGAPQSCLLTVKVPVSCSCCVTWANSLCDGVWRCGKHSWYSLLAVHPLPPALPYTLRIPQTCTASCLLYWWCTGIDLVSKQGADNKWQLVHAIVSILLHVPGQGTLRRFSFPNQTLTSYTSELKLS